MNLISFVDGLCLRVLGCTLGLLICTQTYGGIASRNPHSIKSRRFDRLIHYDAALTRGYIYLGLI